jgi:predicted transcriptional regulator YdeE
MKEMKFTVKKAPAKTVVGISRRTSNAGAAAEIMSCWQEFQQTNAIAKIPQRVAPPVMYAVYSDYEKDWTKSYSYLLGCGVTRAGVVPEGMECRQIPAQTYAVFRAKGRMPDEILAVWANVWASDLPRTYTYDFEVYDKRFARPASREADVYIAIDPERMEPSRQ